MLHYQVKVQHNIPEILPESDHKNFCSYIISLQDKRGGHPCYRYMGQMTQNLYEELASFFTTFVEMVDSRAKLVNLQP